MQLLALFFEALRDNKAFCAIIGDNIQEYQYNKTFQPERDYYTQKLAITDRQRVNTVMDAIGKNGTKKERKIIQKIRRQITRGEYAFFPHKSHNLAMLRKANSVCFHAYKQRILGLLSPILGIPTPCQECKKEDIPVWCYTRQLFLCKECKCDCMHCMAKRGETLKIIQDSEIPF